MRVFVTICGNQVAVADNVTRAEAQLTEVVRGEALHIVHQATEMGDVRRIVHVRVALADMNQ